MAPGIPQRLLEILLKLTLIQQDAVGAFTWAPLY